MQQQAEPEMHDSSDAALYDRYALFTEGEKKLNVIEYAPSFFRKNICNSYVHSFSQEDPMDTFTQSAKRFSLLLIFCTLTLVFSLSACGSQPGLTGSSSTLRQTPTTSSTVAPGTPQLTQQYDFTEQDSGRTVT